MGTNISIWALIVGADPVVKCVMLLLLMVSIGSWSIIIKRISLLKNTERESEQFEDKFWSGADISKLYKPSKESEQGIQAVFHAGYKAFNRLREAHKMPAASIVEEVQRSLRVALARESDRLENQLSILATIGSVSPYVGLFGTVWGIMHSFIALGSVEQATLSQVAPGISEALIATAMGLFVAIPASIAYNVFVASSEKLLNRYDNFAEEFVGIVYRQLNGIKTHDEQDN
ncbi:MAG: biopolymer transport protein [Gammaproteobacteria bacterium]|nr:biopolymer transport protein [Gammaproteobacteria bacterium]